MPIEVVNDLKERLRLERFASGKWTEQLARGSPGGCINPTRFTLRCRRHDAYALVGLPCDDALDTVPQAFRAGEDELPMRVHLRMNRVERNGQDFEFMSRPDRHHERNGRSK